MYEIVYVGSVKNPPVQLTYGFTNLHSKYPWSEIAPVFTVRNLKIYFLVLCVANLILGVHALNVCVCLRQNNNAV